MTDFNCIFINKVNKNKDKPELKAKSTYFDNFEIVCGKR